MLTPKLDRCGVAGVMRRVILREATATGSLSKSVGERGGSRERRRSIHSNARSASGRSHARRSRGRRRARCAHSCRRDSCPCWKVLPMRRRAIGPVLALLRGAHGGRRFGVYCVVRTRSSPRPGLPHEPRPAWKCPRVPAFAPSSACSASAASSMMRAVALYLRGLHNVHPKIKAGTYDFPAGASPAQIFHDARARSGGAGAAHGRRGLDVRRSAQGARDSILPSRRRLTRQDGRRGDGRDRPRRTSSRKGASSRYLSLRRAHERRRTSSSSRTTAWQRVLAQAWARRARACRSRRL